MARHVLGDKNNGKNVNENMIIAVQCKMLLLENEQVRQRVVKQQQILISFVVFTAH